MSTGTPGYLSDDGGFADPRCANCALGEHSGGAPDSTLRISFCPASRVYGASFLPPSQSVTAVWRFSYRPTGCACAVLISSTIGRGCGSPSRPAGEPRHGSNRCACRAIPAPRNRPIAGKPRGAKAGLCRAIRAPAYGYATECSWASCVLPFALPQSGLLTRGIGRDLSRLKSQSEK